MTSLRMEANLADPCLFVNKDSEVSAINILYVDDGKNIDTSEMTEKTLSGPSKEFNIKILGKSEKYIGCQITEDPKTKTIWITQPNILQDIEQKFGHIMPNKIYDTPAAPIMMINHPTETDTKISSKRQTEYRSGTGMLLYLIKHSRPELSNAVWELTKVLDGATEAHLKAMLRTIKYILDTKNYGLVLRPHDQRRHEVCLERAQ